MTIDNEEKTKKQMCLELTREGLDQIKTAISDFEKYLNSNDDEEQKFASMGILALYEFLKEDIASKIIALSIKVSRGQEGEE